MSTDAEFELLLRTYGLKLIRQRKHRVYAAPDGRRFVTASSPSDCRAASNRLASLRRFCRRFLTKGEGGTNVER